MALQLDKLLPTGVTANYWRIINFSIDVNSLTGSVGLALYLSAAARQAGKDPIFMTQIAFGGPGVPFPISALATKDPITVAYTAIKASPDLAGAIDVL